MATTYHKPIVTPENVGRFTLTAEKLLAFQEILDGAHRDWDVTTDAGDNDYYEGVADTVENILSILAASV